jgi:hypothetical protein
MSRYPAQPLEEKLAWMRERQDGPREVAFDEHFTVQELATIWKLSRHTVKRLVERDPDVVRMGEKKPGVRAHFTLRVPAHAARRIYQQLTGKIERPAEKKPPARFKPSLVKRSRA